MLPDLVQETIESDREEFYSSCSNCIIKSVTNFNGNSGYICSGHVKYPGKNTSFDIIRLCISHPEFYEQHNLAPDEALEIVRVLTDSVNEWMYNTPAYKKFRKVIIPDTKN